MKFDFFINARSMMEMDSGTISDYFNFIHKYSHEESFFLNVNRYEKIINHRLKVTKSIKRYLLL